MPPDPTPGWWWYEAPGERVVVWIPSYDGPTVRWLRPVLTPEEHDALLAELAAYREAVRTGLLAYTDPVADRTTKEGA